MVTKAVDEFRALEILRGRLPARLCDAAANNWRKGIRDEIGVNEGRASGCANEGWARRSCDRWRQVGDGVAGLVGRFEDLGDILEDTIRQKRQFAYGL